MYISSKAILFIFSRPFNKTKFTKCDEAGQLQFLQKHFPAGGTGQWEGLFFPSSVHTAGTLKKTDAWEPRLWVFSVCAKWHVKYDENGVFKLTYTNANVYAYIMRAILSKSTGSSGELNFLMSVINRSTPWYTVSSIDKELTEAFL